MDRSLRSPRPVAFGWHVVNYWKLDDSRLRSLETLLSEARRMPRRAVVASGIYLFARGGRLAEIILSLAPLWFSEFSGCEITGVV